MHEPGSQAPSLPGSGDFAAARALFPGAREQTYLSVCDRGILGDHTVAALHGYLAAMQGTRLQRRDYEAVVDDTKARFAALIGADASEIALSGNVSDGVNAIANALPWQAGDNVIVTTELEHPNNLYPWMRLAERGVEIRTVPMREGAIDVAAMRAAMDERTRAATAASVTFSPGLRTDLAGLGATCRARGVFLLVDAVQSAGILRHDVTAERIDALVTSTSKGLLGLYGCGLLYCRSDWADRLAPVYLSRTGANVAPDKPSEMGTAVFRAGAGRFEVGSYNFAGAYAARASLALVAALGAEAIQAHVLSLSRRLTDGLARLGLPVTQPPREAARAHIVTVGKLGDGGHDMARDEALQAWSAALKAAGVVHTIRRGQLRFAAHLYNDMTDIDRVLALSAAHFARG